VDLLFDSLGSEFRAPEVTAALDALAAMDEVQRGAVFTRREVVQAILDLVGYVADRPLHRMRLLEPSFGEGDFLLPAIDRLLEAHARVRAGASVRRDARWRARSGRWNCTATVSSARCGRSKSV
jgi:hypothetical protein